MEQNRIKRKMRIKPRRGKINHEFHGVQSNRLNPKSGTEAKEVNEEHKYNMSQADLG